MSAQAEWVDANQRCLAAEFERLRGRLDGAHGESAERHVEHAPFSPSAAPAIDQLTDAFGLSAFERDLLLLCAGVELDGELAAACAARPETRRRPVATFGLALARFADSHWSAVTPVGTLRRWRLIDVEDGQPLVGARLSVDERVLHFLLGVSYLDPRVQPLVQPVDAPGAVAATHVRVAEAVVRAVRQCDGAIPLVQLHGDDGAAQRAVAGIVAEGLGLRLHALRASDIPAGPHEAEALSVLWQREGTLLRSALLIDEDVAGSSALARFVGPLGGLTFVAARGPVPVDRSELRFAVDKPGAAEQKRLWIQVLGGAAGRLDGALDGVATQFRFSADTILRAGGRLRSELLSSDAPDRLLWRECRASARQRLDDLAQRIEPLASWSDFVLPEPQIATLRQIAARVRQRLRVYDEWGFARVSARGLGITALFSGESGTGKTMAAEVLANDLHLDLYRIDLAAVVSKYIGETEKNLRRVFDAAEESGAILLFDEADALFGKRSEVKDSHDRYANIEVSYLLQRMDAYRGLAILTTNLKAALDPAMQRRLRFALHFDFPDLQQRERIWRRVFPPAAPLGDIDHAKLARLNVAGGGIRNIALSAAFFAAEQREAIGMPHLLQAARAESAKRERPFADAETRGWA